jgi:hypothetical protein
MLDQANIPNETPNPAQTIPPTAEKTYYSFEDASGVISRVLVVRLVMKHGYALSKVNTIKEYKGGRALQTSLPYL